MAVIAAAAFRRPKHHREYMMTSAGSSVEQLCEPIIINVAGKRFETYEHTLNRFPNTLLGDPLRRAKYFQVKRKEYFFDRHRSSFTAILHFFQSNGLITKPQNVPQHIFLKEVMFFDLGEKAMDQLGHEHPNKHLESLKIETEKLPKSKVQLFIYQLFDEPASSFGARVLAIFSLMIIILSIFVFCLETLPQFQNTYERLPSGNSTTEVLVSFDYKHMWFCVSAMCNAWFTFELVVRFLVSPDKLAFLKQVLNIIDLLSILPFYVSLALSQSNEGSSIEILRVMRVIRVARIFKLTRHSRGLLILGQTLKASINELLLLMLFMLIGVIIFASCIYFAEGGSDFFPSIPDSFWWAVVTMTTVGYGDVYPETGIGKLIGTCCALSGVLAIALPVPVIVSNFEEYYKQDQARQKAKLEFEKEERNRSKKEEIPLLSNGNRSNVSENPSIALDSILPDGDSIQYPRSLQVSPVNTPSDPRTPTISRSVPTSPAKQRRFKNEIETSI